MKSIQTKINENCPLKGIKYALTGKLEIVYNIKRIKLYLENEVNLEIDKETKNSLVQDKKKLEEMLPIYDKIINLEGELFEYKKNKSYKQAYTISKEINTNYEVLLRKL